jgi:hypothetical protein
VQIIAITGFLDEERVKHFFLDEAVNEAANEGLAASRSEAVEKLIVPILLE